MAVRTLKNPDHVNAFSHGFTAIWGMTPFATEVNNLAYFRACTCFLGTTQDDLSYRRELMYAYLKNTFATDKIDDTINELYNIIPIESTINRALRVLCSLYSQAPNRKFEVENKQIEVAYNESNINTALRKAHKIARLCNTVLVMPVVRDFKIEFDVLPPDLFRVKTDPKDFKKIIELWIPICTIKDGQNVYSFKVWTEEFYIEYDSEGRETSRELNTIKAIPACLLQLDSSDTTDVYGGANIELLSAAIDSNKLKFLADSDVTYTAFSVWVATNFGKENIKIAPNRILKVDKVTAGEGLEVPPTLESIQGMSAFQQIDDFRLNRDKQSMRNQGLPESMISSNPGLAPSGAALKIDRMELMEIRAEDLDVFSRFENSLYKVMAKVVNYGLGYNLPEKNVVSVNYIEDQEYVDPKDALAEKKELLELGVIGLKDFMNYWQTNELITTDEQALAEMQKNLKLYKELKSYGQPSNTESQTTGSVGVTDGGTNPNSDATVSGQTGAMQTTI